MTSRPRTVRSISHAQANVAAWPPGRPWTLLWSMRMVVGVWCKGFALTPFSMGWYIHAPPPVYTEYFCMCMCTTTEWTRSTKIQTSQLRSTIGIAWSIGVGALEELIAPLPQVCMAARRIGYMGVFDLRNEVIHYLLTSPFFHLVYEMEWVDP